MKNSVLLTGGTGFIGDHLVSELASAGKAIRVCTRQPPCFSSLESIEWYSGCSLESVCSWAPNALVGVDAVVHAAGLAHVAAENTGEALSRYRAVNAYPTRRLAELAAAQGVRRFIFLSSIKVNGDQTREAPFSVADKPAPEGPYAISKWEAEQALWQVAEETGLEVVIIRPPLVYGPGVKANFAQLMRWVRRGVPLPLAGINNRRSLLSVYNLAALVIRCIESSRAPGHVFLASDGEAVSTAELVTELAHAWRKNPRLFKLPPAALFLLARLSGRQATVARLVENLEVDIEPTRRLLEWSPPYSMKETLARMVELEYQKERRMR